MGLGLCAYSTCQSRLCGLCWWKSERIDRSAGVSSMYLFSINHFGLGGGARSERHAFPNAVPFRPVHSIWDTTVVTAPRLHFFKQRRGRSPEALLGVDVWILGAAAVVPARQLTHPDPRSIIIQASRQTRGGRGRGASRFDRLGAAGSSSRSKRRAKDDDRGDVSGDVGLID